jgi:hypothetical protein
MKLLRARLGAAIFRQERNFELTALESEAIASVTDASRLL